MLTKKISLYCCESPTLIENYNDAKEDNTHTWRLHHRFEVNEFGGLSRNELISLGLWLKRPASELIFLSKEDHTKLHKSQKKRSGRANIVIAIKFLLALGFEMKNITLKDIDEMLKKLRKLSILYK